MWGVWRKSIQLFQRFQSMKATSGSKIKNKREIPFAHQSQNGFWFHTSDLVYLELSPGERWPFLHWFEGDEIVLQTPQKITVSQTGGQVILTSPLRSSPTQHGPWPLNWQFNSLHGGLPQPAASFGFFFFLGCGVILERGLLCSALRYRWHCRMEIAASWLWNNNPGLRWLLQLVPAEETRSDR